MATTNVFDFLTDSRGEAMKLRIRSQLMMQVAELVKGWGQRQEDAAAKLGITQPRLNDLLQGKLHKFSTCSLIVMLAEAGCEIDVAITVPAAEG